MAANSNRPGRPEAAAAIWNWRAPAEPENQPDASRVRLRGAIQGGIGMVTGTLFLLYVSRTLGMVVLSLGTLIALSALVSPHGIYAGFDRFFAAVGRAMGTATTWLLMVPTFYLFFLPFGRILRRGRRDRLQRLADPDAATYWERHDGPRSASESREAQY